MDTVWHNPKITAIVVNYNSGLWLARCLTALRKSPVDQVIVIDNGSSDQSMDCMQAKNYANISLVINPHNPGYASACNQGLEMATGEFVLFMNPDCELLDNALKSLTTALQDNSQAILAGPWIINQQGKVQRATLRRLPTFKTSMNEFLRPASQHGVELSDLVKPEGVQLAEAVSGACMLVRCSMLRELGGFDAQYRLHCEDLDLMQRAALAGYAVLLVPDALVIHQQGVSSRGRPLWVEWQKHRGMWRFYRKFEAAENSIFKQALVAISILGHYLLKAPVIWYQKRFSKVGVYD
ncbi:MAG: glycosyltransferase family 2 protein [Xanthomonadales bacterium]|nr:glycosyltransferase family 2 protein [Xanthomonadales bacterium]